MVLVPLAFYHFRHYTQQRQPLQEPHLQVTPVAATVSAETLEFFDLGLAAIPHPQKVKILLKITFLSIYILQEKNKGGMGEDYAFSSRRVLGKFIS